MPHGNMKVSSFLGTKTGSAPGSNHPNWPSGMDVVKQAMYEIEMHRKKDSDLLKEIAMCNEYWQQALKEE